MQKTIIKFGDIEKQKLHQHKRPISIVPNKGSFVKKCFKYFIG